MDIKLVYVPQDANRWTVTRAIAQVLHAEDFAPISEGRKINFLVRLQPSPSGGIRNNGTGLLTLPSDTVGRNFLRRVQNEPIKILGKKIKFYQQKTLPPEHLVITLRKTRYVDPDVEENRMRTVEKLDRKFRIDTVQFGILYQPENPGKGSPSSRAFSVEWEKDYTVHSYGSMEFEYDHKLIRITLGSQVVEKEGRSLAINFSSIQKIGVGYDGKPYVCFDTLTPPVMEKIDFHRPMTGKSHVDNKKYKQRVGSLNEGHATVAAFSPHLRLILYQDPEPGVDIVDDFVKMCEIAGLSHGMIFRLHAANNIEPIKNAFFTPKRIYDLEKSLSKFPWTVAFQLESLLRNGLLHTGHLDELIPKARLLLQKHAPQFVGEMLRQYNEALQAKSIKESPQQCFERVREKFDFSRPRDDFRCYHITFTPTRMILEGPYAFQSNRVIRQYQGYQDHFIRVDFRDEDRLQYRWDREVDGTPFLVERVGSILKHGFSLAGRSFEFLAYSSSALREHAVWFMNPFKHPDKGWVNANYIRNSLGDFSGTELLKQPSKYAARLAQAFTATDPSIDICKEEWEEVPDLGEDPYLHTDGVGTISPELRDRIWAKLCETKRNTAVLLKPWAFQIRFLGYKGVVVVDETLGNHAGNIHMRLRPSMRKFEVKDNEIAPIEIAQAFELPNTCYLNRPLVMVLEDLGVRMEAFQDLQDAAVADAKTIDDSISHFLDVLSSHRLGYAFRLVHILTRLRDKYHMDLTADRRKTIAVDNPFLRQIRRVAMTDVLRDIKHSARIPVPNSYLLVGVADEGPAYEAAGYDNVYSLEPGEIYGKVDHAYNIADRSQFGLKVVFAYPGVPLYIREMCNKFAPSVNHLKENFVSSVI
ncbi:hypothetical protein D9613_002724 [Agrocybe pediades]|uniref:RNA-dependent RNA polymerase n=1 Tax=Agrocybe pediades TaxID=84607 RepID=A0A8H4QQ41_9AGAR|nr:hypothetical protein D9613_002724 [Agrocybe pediades]